MKVLKHKYNPNKAGVFRISVLEKLKPAVGEGDAVFMSAIPKEIKGIFYAPVMIPDVKIQRIDENTGEKYMVYYDAETVEQLANNYFRQCGNRCTNMDHEKEDTDGIYPIESWIVKDPESDKSKAIGMPLQKEGTWIMGYKADNPEVLEKIKNNLLQGLSIEGILDTEEDTENPITKFNKHFMKKTPLEFAKHLANVIMSAVTDEEKTVEKTPEELAAEEATKKMESDVEPDPADPNEPTEDPAQESTDTAKELETAKATIDELTKKNSDLEAELATYKNDATLMSAQLEEVNKAFESYKAVKMSSQKLGDTPVKDEPTILSIPSRVEEMRANRI